MKIAQLEQVLEDHANDVHISVFFYTKDEAEEQLNEICEDVNCGCLVEDGTEAEPHTINVDEWEEIVKYMADDDYLYQIFHETFKDAVKAFANDKNAKKKAEVVASE